MFDGYTFENHLVSIEISSENDIRGKLTISVLGNEIKCAKYSIYLKYALYLK